MSLFDLHSDFKLDNYSRKFDDKFQPFISGYNYIFIELPDCFDNSDKTNAQLLLSTTAQSFTPPSKSISKFEIFGFGGVKKYIPLSQELSSTFNIKFIELSNTPISKIINKWTSSIYNSMYGFQDSKQYKGSCFVLITKPTRSSDPIEYLMKDDVEELYIFEGVFPERAVSENFTTDITSNDKVEMDIPFNYDGCFININNIDNINNQNNIIDSQAFDTIVKKFGKWKPINYHELDLKIYK